MNKMDQIKKITDTLAEICFENSNKMPDGLYKTLMDSLHEINKITTDTIEDDNETEEYENSDPDEDEHIIIDDIEYTLRPQIVDELITNRYLVINSNGIICGYLIDGIVEWNKEVETIVIKGIEYYLNEEFVFDENGILCGEIKNGIITIFN